jgi:hypothetical protein
MRPGHAAGRQEEQQAVKRYSKEIFKAITENGFNRLAVGDFYRCFICCHL